MCATLLPYHFVPTPPSVAAYMNISVLAARVGLRSCGCRETASSNLSGFPQCDDRGSDDTGTLYPTVFYCCLGPERAQQLYSITCFRQAPQPLLLLDKSPGPIRLHAQHRKLDKISHIPFGNSGTLGANRVSLALHVQAHTAPFSYTIVLLCM